MSRDDKPVKIISHSPEIDLLSEKYLALVKEALPHATIHRIGSFAVPMKGKEEIDLLVEVEDLQQASDALTAKGFGQGPINKEEAFLSNHTYDIECEVHLVPRKSPKKELYLGHVTRLREDEELREELERLKTSLDGLPRKTYRIKKSNFFKEKELSKK